MVGKIVTATSPTDVTMFTVTVSDPNPGDDLFIRALADYPDVSNNTRPIGGDQRIPHSLDGSLLRQDVTINVSCNTNVLAASITEHPITIIIADRPFGPVIPQPTALTSPDGLFVTANWVLNV